MLLKSVVVVRHTDYSDKRIVGKLILYYDNVSTLTHAKIALKIYASVEASSVRRNSRNASF
jgi:hypothetical protein